MLRRFLAGAALSALLLMGCGQDQGQDATVEIGAVTIVSHPSLDAIYEGFTEGLAEAGYVEGENLKLDFQNPQGDQQTLANITSAFASSSYDLFLTIATPPTQALAQAVSDRPIVFASVTEPVGAGLVDSMEKPGHNVTGTSDQIPPEQQLDRLQQILPGLKTLGIVYTSKEINAEFQAAAMSQAAKARDIEVKTVTVTDSAEVAQAAESLDVDAYWVGNDNTVVSAIESVVQAAEQKGSLLFTSDADSVVRGAAASLATDYKAQGVQTAKIAVKILKGADPATTPVEIQASLEFTVNPEAAKRMGVEIPADVLADADHTV